MQELQNNIKKELEAVLSRVTAEIAVLHSTRATPALVENIPVAAYGGKMPLKQVASLSVPDARTIIVQPWDTSLMPEIQKAIQASNLGMGSAVDEKFIRLNMPQLSEERRREVIKILGKKIEEGRISIRKVRDHAIKALEEQEKKKEISEDEKFRSKDTIQKIIDEFNKRASDLEEKKTREIEG